MGSGPARRRTSRKNARQPPPSHSFTLSQEAQNTHRTAWNVSSRLRDNSIAFVSGGRLHQDEPGQYQDDDAVEGDKIPMSSEELLETPSTELDEGGADRRPEHEDQTWGLCNRGLDASLAEEVEQINLSATRQDPSSDRTRSSSASSASSGDVIVFAGRGKPPREFDTSPNAASPSAGTRAVVHPATEMESPMPTISSSLKPDARDFVPGRGADQAGTPVDAFSRWSQVRKPVVNDVKQKLQKYGSKPRHRRVHGDDDDDDDDDDDAIIRDYIENVTVNQNTDDEAAVGEEVPPLRAKLASVSHNKERQSSSTPADFHGRTSRLDWTSDDLRDFDDLGTSDDDVAEIGGVHSRRTRPSGLQYLVTREGRSRDDSKWILHERLTSTSAIELILVFEESHPIGTTDGFEDDDQDHESESSESSEDDPEEEALDDLVRDHEAKHRANENLLQRASTMSDVELARILNKQSELGYGTDEVMLFDSACANEDDYIPFSTQTHTSNRIRSKRNHRSKGAFPSANTFADVLDEEPYGAFDVMDFDRPSLKPKKKGRKSANNLPFELEDEELADHIAQSWANDRAKKSARKTERQELRQAGLLGSKSVKSGNRLDPRADFAQGSMDMDQVKSELRLFLIDNARDSLALSPMANGQRAQVHLLAKALRLKSASYGKGDARYPELTKTDFSGGYDEFTIREIDALLAQRRFSTSWGPKREVRAAGDTGKFGGPRAKSRRGGGGGGVAAGATYMDGEVVGAAAPELGTENKGRAMLEKMGWSSGMGIGKVGNQGRVEVIKHVVKNTKAGLG